MTGIPSRFTVPLKPCGCGVLLGEVCDCAEAAASASRLFANPIILRTAATAGPVDDRPEPAMFAAMRAAVTSPKEARP